MTTSIGIDIGGSGIRGARVEGDRVGPILSRPLPNREAATVVSAVTQLYRDLGTEGPVGVSVPGFIQGPLIRASPNFPTWRDLPLGEQLACALGQPVTLLNDANAAALGAWAQRGEREDLVLLTLGTGVGGGVVTDGRLLLGSRGSGAELGHIYVGGDRTCGCGARGCLETWASTTGLLAAARERNRDCADGQELITRAADGESWAVQVCEEAAEALGRGLASLVNVFNPDTILLCGGLAAARHHFEAQTSAVLKAQGIPANTEQLTLVWGPRAEDYSILGSSHLARQEAP